MSPYSLALLFEVGRTYEAFSIHGDGTRQNRGTRIITGIECAQFGRVIIKYLMDSTPSYMFTLDGSQDVLLVSNTEFIIKWNSHSVFLYRLRPPSTNPEEQYVPF